MSSVFLGSVYATAELKTEGFTKGKSEIEDQLDSLDKTSKSKMAALGASFTSAGKALSIGLTVPIVAAGTAALSLAKIGGQYESVRDSFSSMTQDMGVDVDVFQSRVAAATGDMVDKYTILNQGTRALALIGKDAFNDFGQDFEKMAEMSRKASRATGTDVNYMFESLVMGVARESKLILDNLGISLDITKAKEDYAKSLGKTAKQLTQSEEKTAVLNGAMAQLEEIYGNVAVSAGGFSGTWQKLTTLLTNSRIEIGQALAPAMIDLVNTITPLAKQYIPIFVSGLSKLVKWFTDLSPKSKKVVMLLGLFLAAIGPILIIVGSLISAMFAIGSALALITAPMLIVIAVIVALIAILVVLYLKWDEVVEIFNRAKSSLSEFWENLKTKVKTSIDEIIASLTDVAISVGEFLASIPGKVEELVNRVVDFFKALPERIFNALKGVILRYVEFYGLLFGLIVYGIPKIIESIVNWFRELPEKLSALLDEIVIKWNEIWAAVKYFVDETIPAMIESIKNWFRDLKESLIVLWDDLLNKWDQFWTDVKNFVTITVPKMIDDIRDWFNLLPGRIKSSLEDTKNNAKSGIEDTWKSLKSEVETWPGRMYDWGKNMIKAFADGIRSAIGEIVDAFRAGMDRAKGMVEGKSPPIEGPFKNIDKWGYNIGSAWVQGVQSAISNLTIPDPGMLSSSVSADSVPPPVNNFKTLAPAFTVNIGMYAGSEIEKREIAHELSRALQDYQKGRGRL